MISLHILLTHSPRRGKSQHYSTPVHRSIMHLVLTGATGLVGSAVLQTMLTTPAISKISILSRRPVAQAEGHAKAKVILHKDFAEYGDDVLDGLKDVKGVVWALGISATQVGKECVFCSHILGSALQFAHSHCTPNFPRYFVLAKRKRRLTSHFNRGIANLSFHPQQRIRTHPPHLPPKLRPRPLQNHLPLSPDIHLRLRRRRYAYP